MFVVSHTDKDFLYPDFKTTRDWVGYYRYRCDFPGSLSDRHLIKRIAL